MKPPPQGIALLGCLAWNVHRAINRKPTISMFLRRHRAAFFIFWAWLGAHIGGK